MQINDMTDNSIYTQMNKNENSTILEKIATLKEISLADTASMLIANQLQSQLSSMTQGVMNANDAVGMLQIADGTVSNLSQNTADLAAMAVRYNSASLNSENRTALQANFNSTVDAMRQNVENATFNGQNVFGSQREFSLGGGSVSFSIESIDTSSLDIASPQSIESFASSLQRMQSQIGSSVNGIDSSIKSLFAAQNATAKSLSQIEDADLALTINELQQSNLRIEASVIAQAHKTESLQKRMQSLLGM